MKLLHSAITVSFGTLLSRLFGFVRDMIIAAKLGASPINDAFITAFRIANMLRNIFAEGALSIVFVPEFSKSLATKGDKQALLLASKIHILLILFLTIITTFGIIFMPEIIWYTAPGFRQNPIILEMTILFARITFPYLLCISLAAFYGGVLNCFSKFLPFALAPSILNISTIIALLFFDYFPTSGHTLSLATTMSGIIELLWMIFFLLKYNCKLSWQNKCLTPKTKSIFKKMLPVIFSAGITHLNSWVSIIILSFFTGGITYIYYAERIVQLPLALIGTAIGTALLPTLAKSLLQDRTNQTIALQNKAISLALLLAIPAATALHYIAADIIFLLFERGVFTKIDTDNTADALAILSIGLPAFVMTKLFQTKFYANLNTKIPVVISIFCMLINVIISILTMSRLEFKGVALANTISGWLNFLLLLALAYNKINFKLYFITLQKITKTILASIIMISAIQFWRSNNIFELNQHILIISEMVIGLLIYLLSCLIFKIKIIN